MDLGGQRKRLRSLAIYFPSVLTRYAIQLMLVAMPWVMQSSGFGMNVIAGTLLAFFVGSLLGGLSVPVLFRRVRPDPLMRFAILGQAVISALCLFDFDLNSLQALRFGQGLMLGILRPVNQVWLLEFRRHEKPSDAARSTTYSQVLIALGMALANLLGGLFNFIHDDTARWLFIISVNLGPAIMFAVLTPKPARSPMVEARVEDFGFVNWLLRHPVTLLGVALYVLSLATFKIWMIQYPFSFRTAHHEAEQGLLVGALMAQPLIFAAGQFTAATFLHRVSGRFFLGILMGCCLGQALLTAAAIMVPHALLSLVLLVVGGGFLPAFIHPSLMMVLLQKEAGLSSSVRRKIMVTLSLGADIGQIIGLGLLTAGSSGPESMILCSIAIGALMIAYSMARFARVSLRAEGLH